MGLPSERSFLAPHQCRRPWRPTECSRVPSTRNAKGSRPNVRVSAERPAAPAGPRGRAARSAVTVMRRTVAWRAGGLALPLYGLALLTDARPRSHGSGVSLTFAPGSNRCGLLGRSRARSWRTPGRRGNRVPRRDLRGEVTAGDLRRRPPQSLRARRGRARPTGGRGGRRRRARLDATATDAREHGVEAPSLSTREPFEEAEEIAAGYAKTAGGYPALGRWTVVTEVRSSRFYVPVRGRAAN